MKAYTYTLATIDFSTMKPGTIDYSTELYESMEDFFFGEWIRFLFRYKDYPTAKLHRGWKGVHVEIDGQLVYLCRVVDISKEPVEIPDEDLEDLE